MPDTNAPNILVGAITFEVKALRDAVAIAIQATNKNSRIPILSNIHINTDDAGSVTITGTDMEIAAIVKVPAVYPPALSAFCLEAKPLLDLLKQLPAKDHVHITANSTEPMGARIECGGVKASLPGGYAVDFPSMSFAGAETPVRLFDMSGARLKSAMASVAFAISTDETRYYLNGIYFSGEAGTGELRLAATDGHRLAERSIPEVALPFWREHTEKGPNGIIVPRHTVALVTKLLAKSTSEVKIAFTEAKIRFRFGDVELWSKLIDGTFPDYRRVIPKRKPECELEVAVADLISAAKMGMALSSEKSRPIVVEAIKGDGLYAGRATTSEGAAIAGQRIPLDTPPAFNVETGFQGRYIMDLSACPSPRVTLTFGERMTTWKDERSAEKVMTDTCDGRAPTRFDADEWTMVLMPMRT